MQTALPNLFIVNQITGFAHGYFVLLKELTWGSKIKECIIRPHPEVFFCRDIVNFMSPFGPVCIS